MPSFLAKAFRVARAGRPGPVFLELPWDVLSNGADEALAEAQVALPHRRAHRPGDPRKLEEALALLARAPSGRCWSAGSSIWWDDAADALERARVARRGIPVYLNGMGRGCLPPDHPSFFQRSRKEALAQADVVLVVGTPLDFRIGYGTEPTFAAGAKVIQVDIDAAEIGRNRPIDVGIVGDARSVLEALEAGARLGAGAAAWRGFLREKEAARAERQRAYEESDQRPIHHFRLARAIDTVASRAGDVTYVGDGGNVVAVAAKVLRVRRPRALARPRPARLPRRRRAVRHRREAPRARAAGLRHPGRRRLRPERHGLRDRGPVQAADGGGGRERRRLGADPRPAARRSTARSTPSRPSSRPPATTAWWRRRRRGGARRGPRRPRRPRSSGRSPRATVYCVDVAIDPEAAAASGAAGYAI